MFVYHSRLFITLVHRYSLYPTMIDLLYHTLFSVTPLMYSPRTREWYVHHVIALLFIIEVAKYSLLCIHLCAFDCADVLL